MVQGSCTICLQRTRLAIGQLHVPSPALAETSTVSSGWLTCSLASVSSAKEADYLSSASEGLKEGKTLVLDLCW